MPKLKESKFKTLPLPKLARASTLVWQVPITTTHRGPYSQNQRKGTPSENRHSEEEWLQKRQTVEELYSTHPLTDVARVMAEEHDFHARLAQYRHHLKVWESSWKYLKLSVKQVTYIKRKVIERAIEGKSSLMARLNGKKIPKAKLDGLLSKIFAEPGPSRSLVALPVEFSNVRGANEAENHDDMRCHNPEPDSELNEADQNDSHHAEMNRKASDALKQYPRMEGISSPYSALDPRTLSVEVSAMASSAVQPDSTLLGADKSYNDHVEVMRRCRMEIKHLREEYVQRQGQNLPELPKHPHAAGTRANSTSSGGISVLTPSTSTQGTQISRSAIARLIGSVKSPSYIPHPERRPQRRMTPQLSKNGRERVKRILARLPDVRPETVFQPNTEQNAIKQWSVSCLPALEPHLNLITRIDRYNFTFAVLSLALGCLTSTHWLNFIMKYLDDFQTRLVPLLQSGELQFRTLLLELKSETLLKITQLYMEAYHSEAKSTVSRPVPPTIPQSLGSHRNRRIALYRAYRVSLQHLSHASERETLGIYPYLSAIVDTRGGGQNGAPFRRMEARCNDHILYMNSYLWKIRCANCDSFLFGTLKGRKYYSDIALDACSYPCITNVSFFSIIQQDDSRKILHVQPLEPKSRPFNDMQADKDPTVSCRCMAWDNSPPFSFSKKPTDIDLDLSLLKLFESFYTGGANHVKKSTVDNNLEKQDECHEVIGSEEGSTAEVPASSLPDDSDMLSVGDILEDRLWRESASPPA